MSITEDADSHLFGGVSSKGRLRRPSAKILANTVPPANAWKQAHLVLQSGVAEVVMNDSESEDLIDARTSPVTVDLSAWVAGEPKQKKVKEVPVKPDTTSPALTQSLAPLDDLIGPVDDAGSFESVDEQPSTNPTVTSPGEVKRKRGRPFKGQEKPIEERLLIETSKIRRLIDDILRKGPKEASEFCVRLRTIAKDLDQVMTLSNVEISDEHEYSTPPTLQ